MENTEQLHMSGNAENTNNKGLNSSELIQYVEGTPFAVVESEEGFFVIMGKYRMSESFQKSSEAIKDAKRITWMRILQVIGATIENYEKEDKEKTTIKKV